mmetsp:Transcript_16424/g.22795  ORF Transcript_16424/g.22795 Transcript_16424/m.22795 type:complete len:604 (+) Transcript_16424:125-1936(+)
MKLACSGLFPDFAKPIQKLTIHANETEMDQKKGNWGGKKQSNSNNNAQYMKASTDSQSSTKSNRSVKPGKMYSNGPSGLETISYYSEIMNAAPIKLTDEQLAQFIVEGFLLLPTDLPAEFHQQVYKNAEITAGQTNPGNNILATIPALSQVYYCPTIKGALQSILGEGYIMHTHRFPHANPPGFKEQQLHKDSYWGHTKDRHHLPRWVMAMYYPQDTPIVLGPTAVAPASQYLAMPASKDKRTGHLPPEWGSQPIPMKCNAGSVALIHYDVWHKGTANAGDKLRFMFKFQFARMTEPIYNAPSWNNTSEEWPEAVAKNLIAKHKYADLTPVWKTVWNWMRGQYAKGSPESMNVESKENVNTLTKMLEDVAPGAEPARLCAAYTLGAMGEVAVLAQYLQSEKEPVQRSAAYGIIAAGSAAVEPLMQITRSAKSDWTLQKAIFALGELGPLAERALPLIVDVCGHSSPHVRRVAVSTLGQVAQLLVPLASNNNNTSNENASTKSKGKDIKEEVVKTLLNRTVHDDDDQTRFQACLSLAQVAHFAKFNPEVLPAIAEAAVSDPNRYVRGYSVIVLKKLGTPEAKDKLIDILMTSRYCDLTTKDSGF